MPSSLRSSLRGAWPATATGRGVLIALLACSSTPAASPTVRFMTESATPNYLDIPFPSDAYLQNGFVGAIPGIDAVITQSSAQLTHALAVENGFGRVTFAEFYVDDPSAPPADDGSVAASQIDATTFPQAETDCQADASSVFLIDLAAQGAAMRLPCRAYWHAAPFGRTRPVLGVGPARGLVLQGGHKYAAVLTTRVKDQNGNAIAPSADFTAIATGNRTAGVGSLYGSAYDTVMGGLKTALGTAQIAGMAVFTTHSTEEELYGLRDALESAAAPMLAWDAGAMAPMGATRFTSHSPLPMGFTASLDDWLGTATEKLPDSTDDPDANLPVRAHDAIDAIGTAVFSAINYLNVRPNGYVDPDHANFARDASGKIVPAPEQPTSKYLGHALRAEDHHAGVGVPRRHRPARSLELAGVGLHLANTFCKNGWMVAAIDSVTFGARAPEAEYQVDQHSIWAKAPGAKYDGPDGLADPVNGSFNGLGDLFGTLLNIGALRDQLRQAEFDTAQLAKVLRSNPDSSDAPDGHDGA